MASMTIQRKHRDLLNQGAYLLIRFSIAMPLPAERSTERPALFLVLVLKMSVKSESSSILPLSTSIIGPAREDQKIK